MESLANLEAFVRSAEHGSFSEAARRLSLTPAAVSRNVAMLERNLGVRLFHRSTRRLTLTEAGETFRAGIANNLEGLQAAIAGVSAGGGEPVGDLTGWLWTGLIERISQDRRSWTCGEVRRRARSRWC
jgi:DNA-binding transcriptional LysR family regulator